MHLKQTESDSAVSPVIGVILMVAITVVLAAVIGSVVFNIGSNVEGQVTAAVEYDQASTVVTLSDLGGSATKVIINDGNSSSSTSLTSVGETFDLDANGYEAPVTVVASDGQGNNATVRTIDSL